jgi:hypothetical protein
VIETVNAVTPAELERTIKLSTPDKPVWTGMDIVRLTSGGMSGCTAVRSPA